MKIQKLLVTAGLAVLTAGMGTAGTVSYTASTASQPTDFSYSLLLQKFNASLGTLTGVTIYLYGTESVTTLSLTNTASIAENFILSATSQITGSTNTANAADKFATETLQQINTGVITLGPNGAGNCPTGTPSAGCSAVAYSPFTVSNVVGCPSCGTVGTGIAGVTGIQIAGTNILSSYVSAGPSTSFILSGSTLAGTTFSGGGGNILLTQVTNGSFKAEVDYTYTPSGVPEPATFVLLGSALLGVGVLRKKLS